MEARARARRRIVVIDTVHFAAPSTDAGFAEVAVVWQDLAERVLVAVR